MHDDAARDVQCAAHSETDIELTLQAFDEAMQIVATAKEEGTIEQQLVGPVIEPVIRGQLRVSG